MALRTTLATAVSGLAVVWGPIGPANAKLPTVTAGASSSLVAGNRAPASITKPIDVRAGASRLLCRVNPVLEHAEGGVSIALAPRRAPGGDAFYSPPRTLPGCTHGDLVYQRRLDNPAAALRDGDDWLVMYRSEDVRGTAVATSGIIALPKSPPPRGGYPVITWAHGTVGVADSCAPSRDRPESGAHPMNAYPQTLLNQFLRQGWAVAMTDFEGLGTTDRTHPYLLGASEAHGVLDIVRAARHMFGRRVSSRFAIVGHSQGGQAALFAAHHASWTPELRLAGVAAIAPANHLLGLVQAGAGLTAMLPGFAFTPLFLSGAIAADPTISAADVLSDRAYRDHWPQVEQRCRAGLSESDSWGGLRGNEQFKPGYLTAPNDDQQRFNQQVRDMNPNVTISVPVRITQAADDERVYANPAPLAGTDALVRELDETNGGNPVIYQRYDAGVVSPDVALGIHFGTINHDTPALVAWLGGLLR
jgi:alpha-beta hydrolase superfamily lysophospholipase